MCIRDSTDIVKDIHNLATEGDVLPEKTIKNLPVFGKLWYNFFCGVLENALKIQKSERRND